MAISRRGIESKTAREKLPISSKPVWVSVGPGVGLGYRRNRTEGSWVARLADGKGGYATRNIGMADDIARANGKDVLDYWQAADKARQLANRGTSQEAAIVTVGNALSLYEADIRTRGADAGNASRLRGHLSTPLLQRPVALLSTAELRRWRDGLAKSLAASTVNRVSTIMKASLNYAADHDERIASRRAWEVGLATIANANESRNVILPEGVVREIVAEARRIGPELGLLVELAAVTGARFSQLAAIEVQDLHGEVESARLSIPVSKKGRGVKAVPRYTVPIGPALATRLRLASVNRPVTTPLLLKPSGDRWRESDHARPFARAARAAGQDPGEVTMYALRHSSIVRQLLAGVPARVVAASHDTSIVMLERTYSVHIVDHADALSRRAMLDIGDAGAEIIPIRSQKSRQNVAGDR